ncbi:DNA replication licensing factor MCM4, partial [Pancytospora epiphaga]
MAGSVFSDAFSFEENVNQETHGEFTFSQNEIGSAHASFVETGRTKLIWGTTINVETIAEGFKEFIRSTALEQIERMHTTHVFVFNLDCSSISSTLRENLEFYPQEIFPILEGSLRDVYQELYLEAPGRISIRPTSVGDQLSIRSMDPSHIDRIVHITGMVIRVSAVIPEVSRALFRCAKCSREVFVDSVKGMISEPKACECGARLAFEVCHGSGEYVDTQVLKVQELPESIPDATTPMTITVIARDSLVDALIPGDKVKITGVLKAVPVRINPLLKKIKSSFRIYLEMLSVQPLVKPVKEQSDYIEEIDELRKRSDIYELLSRSIAPSIYGMSDVKKGLLLQLLKGVNKDLGTSQLRGDINVLLAGDPGISKSQILSFIHRISDRGMYTSGRG